VALQALPAERPTRRDAGSHHGELHHFYKLDCLLLKVFCGLKLQRDDSHLFDKISPQQEKITAKESGEKLNGRPDSFESRTPGQPSPRTAHFGM
jgi:hypothetical protein